MLFLEDGPLVATMEDAGIPAGVISWAANAVSPSGAHQLWRWLRKHPVEIVHFHHGGRAMRAVARLAGTTAIVRHVHERAVESLDVPAVKMKIRYADAVIACSQAIAECIVEPVAEVIYSGIETENELPAPRAAEGPLKVGVLSRLVPLKNIEAVIEAGARVSRNGGDVCVEIAGTGASEPCLRERAAKLGMIGKVNFLGWREDVKSLLASWDVLAMPSQVEGFPIAALEAMAAARPVIASQVGGLCELVVDGVTGRLIPPGDIDALACCMAELANDRERLVSMGSEGWKRANQQFSITAMAQQTFALYERLLQ